MRRLVPIALAAVAFLAAPSSADDLCFGTQEDVLVCARPDSVPGVDPNGSSIDRCVQLGTPPCTPVSVPVPTLVPGDGRSPVFVDFGGSIALALCRVIDPPVCG